MQSYYSTNSFELCLETFGNSNRMKKGHVYGPVLTGSYIFQYCYEGCGTFVIDDIIYHIKAGECIVTLPTQTRIEKADTKDPWSLIWIGLSGQSAVIFFEEIGITASNPIIKDCSKSRILQRLQKVIEVANKTDSQTNFLLGESLFSFMKECIHFTGTSIKNEQPIIDRYVEQAIYYMNMHYATSDINIQSLADSMGLNRSYFYEIFKLKTGTSPKEYLTQLRIQKACEYLSMPHSTITSTAFSVGYEPSAFSRAFKNVMGVNPSEYRNKL